MNGPDVNFKSPEWEKIEAWLRTELLDTYKELASTSISSEKTEQLRGRAAYITKLLDLGTPLPAIRR